MIIEKQTEIYSDCTTESFVSSNDLLKLLEKRNEFKDDLLRIFNIDENKIEVFQIGNSKQLILSLIRLDSLCDKIDISKKIKDIHLFKMLEAEKATFEIFSIEDNEILSANKSDLLTAETRYSAKHDLLDLYNFSKFANYCRDKEYEDLIDIIKKHLVAKNKDNNNQINLRLIHKLDENIFFIRAITSIHGYRDYGLNFSVFVALIALGRYVTKSKSEIFIDHYSVNDSEIYVSFRLSKVVKLNENLTLSISLVLENDEIKRSAVSFNGVCKLTYLDKNKKSEIYIKPKGLKKEGKSYAVDLLTYSHRGSVAKVYEKIEELPKVIEEFISQVSQDAPRISSIKEPDDVRKFIANKVKYSKKKEFQVYKERVFKKLMKISVDNTFNLFELLREVEDLFEHEDIVSRDFWRLKLYEALIEKE